MQAFNFYKKTIRLCLSLIFFINNGFFIKEALSKDFRLALYNFETEGNVIENFRLKGELDKFTKVTEAIDSEISKQNRFQYKFSIFFIFNLGLALASSEIGYILL